MPGMTDRDHFAAAALTGLLSQCAAEDREAAETAAAAMRYADAMLRERGNHSETPNSSPNLDAAPAAIAPEPEPEPAARRLPAGGTGDTDHGAAPADSPQPIACSVFDRSQPIAKPTPVHTPPAHATPSVGSVPRDGTEPEAWAVCTPGDGDWSPCFFHEPHAQRCASAIFGSKNIVPLYRHPPCQDASQKNLTLTDAEREAVERAVDSIASTMPYESQQGLADWKTLRGLLRRMGGGR